MLKTHTDVNGPIIKGEAYFFLLNLAAYNETGEFVSCSGLIVAMDLEQAEDVGMKLCKKEFQDYSNHQVVVNFYPTEQIELMLNQVRESEES